MSWQEYQNNDRREQEQLEIIRALIEDATKDTTLWLQDDPSAEERIHVLAIQTGLADLARIVERRMERRKLPKDEREYSETVSEVLSRLEKARKLRGNIIVGRGLGRLTERLPQELPGAKARGVTQAPAPPHDWHEELRRARNMEDDFGFLTFGHAWGSVKQLAQATDSIDQEKRIDNLWRMYPEAAEKLGLPKLPASQVKPAASSSVESRADPGTNPPKRPRVKLPAPVRTVNTSGSIGLGSHELKLTQRPLNPPTYFPEDLWVSTCVILDEAIGKFPNREQLPELCRRYISKMTPVYCEAVKSGKMKAGWVLQERLGGMLDLLHSLLAHNDDGPSSGGLSNKTYGTYEAARNSKEFRKLEKAIADVQTEMQDNRTGADRLRTGEQQAESSRAQNSATSAQGVASKSTNHRALVDAYIQEVRTKKGKRVTMKEIWSAAGYNSRTEFERWVRQDPKHPNKAADETFTRLLCVEKPHLK
jgi:hypothetical protein